MAKPLVLGILATMLSFGAWSHGACAGAAANTSLYQDNRSVEVPSRFAEAETVPVVPPEPAQAGEGPGSRATSEFRGSAISRLKSVSEEITRLRQRIETETKRIVHTKETELARVVEDYQQGLATIEPKDMFEKTHEFHERKARETSELTERREQDTLKVEGKFTDALNMKVSPLRQKLKQLLGETVIVTLDEVEIEGYDADTEVFQGRFKLNTDGIAKEERFTLPMPIKEARSFWEVRERLVGRVRLSLHPADLKVRLEKFWLEDPESGSVTWEIVLAGTSFTDCAVCPEMVIVPAGAFMMGGSGVVNSPRHRVTIEKPLAVGVYEVTFEEWDACLEAGGCSGYRPSDLNWGRGRRPVINVNWDDARAYVKWLSEKTGEWYRLLSEAEWEYAARAGTTGGFHTGVMIELSKANYYNSAGTVAVGSFPPNEFGLHDLHGNVWEWTADCWNSSYRGAPDNGRAWKSGKCDHRVKRGGSWLSKMSLLRYNYRKHEHRVARNKVTGFRVARELTP